MWRLSQSLCVLQPLYTNPGRVQFTGWKYGTSCLRTVGVPFEAHFLIGAAVRFVYLLVFIKMDVLFILEKSFLLQMLCVSGVSAQHTARKSDCLDNSSMDTEHTHTHTHVCRSSGLTNPCSGSSRIRGPGSVYRIRPGWILPAPVGVPRLRRWTSWP